MKASPAMQTLFPVGKEVRQARDRVVVSGIPETKVPMTGPTGVRLAKEAGIELKHPVPAMATESQTMTTTIQETEAGKTMTKAEKKSRKKRKRQKTKAKQQKMPVPLHLQLLLLQLLPKVIGCLSMIL
jgi:Na+-transporting methylmalonyl-CoA/oxaloacetate decarboxylase beta subunit